MRWFERRLREFLNVTDLDLSSRDASISDLEDAVDDLIEVHDFSLVDNTSKSTNSTSYIAIEANEDVTVTVESGEDVIASADIAFTVSSAGNRVFFRLRDVTNGVTLVTQEMRGVIGSTSGLYQQVNISRRFTPAATGTLQIQMQWTVVGTMTAYSQSRHLQVTRVKS